MFHPSRGGVRGGADQFEWEDVKADKHRECYLGHSLKAPVGRWQKGKDLQCIFHSCFEYFTTTPPHVCHSENMSAVLRYTRGGQGGGHQLSNNEEKDAIRRMEAEVLAAALGKGHVKKTQTSLTKQELAEFCRKGQLERDSTDIERVEGMGFGRTRASLVDHITSPTKETMPALASDQVQSTTTVKRDRSENKESSKKKHKKEKKLKREKKRQKKRHRHSDSSDQEKEGKRKKSRHDSESEADKGTEDQLRRRRAPQKSDLIERERREHKAIRRRHDSNSADEGVSTQRKAEKGGRDASRHPNARDDKEADQHRRCNSDSDHKRHTTWKNRKEKSRE